MTHSTGYFINSRTHDVRRIYEHATAVVADPQSFGVELSEVEGLQPRKDRFEILARVMRVGWIRVRRRKDDMSVEFSCSWTEAILAVAVNADLIGFGPMTFVVFRHIETRESIQTYARDVLEAVEDQRIADLLEQKIRRGVEK